MPTNTGHRQILGHAFPRFAQQWRKLTIVKKFCCCFAVIVLASVLLVTFAGGAFGITGVDITALINAASEDGAQGLVFLGHVYNIDINARQVQISWLIQGCGSNYTIPDSAFYNAEHCGALSIPIDVYVDGSTQPVASYDPSHIDYDPSTNTSIYDQAFYEFQTSPLMAISAWSIRPDQSANDQQSGYPFDKYRLQTTFVAIDHNTNASLPILSLFTVDATQNMVPAIDQNVATYTFLNGTRVTARTIAAVFRRTPLTICFVVIILLVNWLLALVVLFITLKAAAGAKVSEAILLLPLSVILTIPALRALWVGAPSFGLLIDSCGLFPQMVIVSLCSIFLVASISLGHEPARDNAPSTSESQLELSVLPVASSKGHA